MLLLLILKFRVLLKFGPHSFEECPEISISAESSCTMGSYLNFKNFIDTPHTESNGGKSMGSGNFPLARQSSIYSLTFDELQTTCGLGKDLGSMNLEDLLKNIWTAEESSQGLASSTGVGDVSMAAGNLQRQGSLALPRTLSQKTVDEVWKDFHKETTVSSNIGQKRSNLGEMTLEEFLVKAGVVREDTQPTGASNDVGFTGVLGQLSTNNNALNIGFQQPTQSPGLWSNQFAENNVLNVVSEKSSQQQPKQRQPLIPKQTNVAFASPMQLENNHQLASPGARAPVVQGSVMQGGVTLTSVKRGSAGNQLSLDMIAKNNVDTSISPSPYAFSEGGRGRRSCSSLEKVVERRHKRMIKNRESAARSRARKQAYTLQLEAEVEKLKEINEELQKKQAEFIDMQKNQLLEKTNMSWGNKLKCLKRTLTGPW
ncbi:ABSCISIC ACID-INSENSITIVE 5-like protein 4 isoform X1 [Lycium barbarum]|uniref:ABSCISIC ACID-INSENSITIVE 5-like protein 4 isoform X1 n=2 Tax=Lycium barbarum TaxID=112863 RepID=UPI00293F33D9|nr:ABSCISIC ACID-INSENSITIVE 5-like protein 4 isoform X1 [Lycium barbarum]